MAFITKNGQISTTPVKKLNQKKFITKNGQISRLIPYNPTDRILAVTGYAQKVLSIAGNAIDKINGTLLSAIDKVIGVE